MSARRISLIYQIISCSIIRPIIFRFNFIYISARRRMEFSSVCINNIRRRLRLLGCSCLLLSGNPFLFSLFGSSVCFSLLLSFRSGLGFSISFCFSLLFSFFFGSLFFFLFFWLFLLLPFLPFRRLNVLFLLWLSVLPLQLFCP